MTDRVKNNVGKELSPKFWRHRPIIALKINMYQILCLECLKLHDNEVTEAEMRPVLARIKPCALAA